MGGQVTIMFTLDGGGYTLAASAAISRTCLVDGLAHNITPGSWTTDITFSNADTRVFLMLDDDPFGALDLGRLAF